ncbi:ABC transporter ATP-binding protein [Desulfonatronum sp. SC1]|uniref:ABC transporter ATP-binding protein n=1 Tax=Desulfonatronum sp. SC1 TaxID=2109626 RepID=UPI000D30BAF1|nr:ABC transporter ATP-binding protein [Desulfonatronum sp. SC1]PTN38490.1 macrolide ABC transporter ATP-binding protein [Desulfonatronum sp. SC1]
MSLFKLENIRKSFTLGPVQVEVLKGVDLEVGAGELVSIMGTSGCGKSTLMNVIGFLDQPTSGRYLMEGRETSSLSDRELSTIRNQKIGFVFQQFNLLGRLTALENVCLPLIYRGMAEREQRRIAREMLERVGMAERAGHKPTELSGGQQQRVAIARALAGSPSIILADEPTGALDTQVGQDIMNLFLELNATQRITTILITHDPLIAAQCRRVVRMKDGVIADGAQARTTP